MSSSPKIAFALEDVKPLREKIAASIRDSIIDGRIKPGERLLEPDVAKMLGVSRTPLREAFFQLESEGFVVVTPRRGAVVSELSEKDAAEIYIIKSTLEALAGRLAMKYITDDTVKKLIVLNDQMMKIAKSKEKDYRALLDLNADFHRILNEAASNGKLLQQINLLRNQTLRYNYIYLSVLSHLDQSIGEHAQIIDASKKRDADAIEALLKNHGENAGKALCEYISKTTH
jgi:DNA-binding GntR family transcriptional regulator